MCLRRRTAEFLLIEVDRSAVESEVRTADVFPALATPTNQLALNESLIAVLDKVQRLACSPTQSNASFPGTSILLCSFDSWAILDSNHS